MAANNMSNIHVSPNVLWTLMPLQQENLCKPRNLLKQDSNTDASCEICEIFKNTYFQEHLQMTTFASQVLQSSKNHC